MQFKFVTCCCKNFRFFFTWDKFTDWPTTYRTVSKLIDEWWVLEFYSTAAARTTRENDSVCMFECYDWCNYRVHTERCFLKDGIVHQICQYHVHYHFYRKFLWPLIWNSINIFKIFIFYKIFKYTPKEQYGRCLSHVKK